MQHPALHYIVRLYTGVATASCHAHYLKLIRCQIGLDGIIVRYYHCLNVTHFNDGAESPTEDWGVIPADYLCKRMCYGKSCSIYTVYKSLCIFDER